MDTNNMTIQDLLRELAAARKDAEEAKKHCEDILNGVRMSDTYQRWDTQRTGSATVAEELTVAIKARAVAEFDGENKHPLPGVDIQEKTVAILVDEQQARKYAIEQAPRLVSVDWKGLEKIAIKLSGTPAEMRFYDVQKVPTATIATDLSQYLAKEGAPWYEKLEPWRTSPSRTEEE